MPRRLLMSVPIVCMLASPAWAETIRVEDKLGARLLGLDAAVFDASLQALVIAAAQSDWRDSPGTDVWWVSLESPTITDKRWMAQVKVFPTLRHPGNGEPQCCVSFTSGDTEFWIKAKPARTPSTVEETKEPKAGKEPKTSTGGLPDTTAVEAEPGDDYLKVAGAIRSLMVETIVPAALSEALSGDPLSSTSPQRADGLIGVAQVPEPGSLLLLALGLAAAGRRLRLATH